MNQPFRGRFQRQRELNPLEHNGVSVGQRYPEATYAATLSKNQRVPSG